MSVQRSTTASGRVRYRARVKSHGRYVTTRVFDRKADAVAWEQDQTRKLRLGEWIDPRRGRVPLSALAEDWLASRNAMKRRTRESEVAAWNTHICPRFGNWPVASITTGEVAAWVGSLIASGRAPATAARILAVLRSILAHGVADGRVTVNVAAAVKAPRGSASRREGRALTLNQLHTLHAAYAGDATDVVLVLGLTRAALGRVGRIARRRPDHRSWARAARTARRARQPRRWRAVHRYREVPPRVDRPARRRARPPRRPLGEWQGGRRLAVPGTGRRSPAGNWKRAVKWAEAKRAVGVEELRVHDLRHTAASIWLGSGADPKVVQAVLGHATASMTMDLYGHLIADNLWASAARIGDTSGTSDGAAHDRAPASEPVNGP